jgi:PAS domain S-box-containing protein
LRLSCFLSSGGTRNNHCEGIPAVSIKQTYKELESCVADLRMHVEHLQSQLAQYQTLSHSFPPGVTVADGQGNIVETTGGAETLLGASRKDGNLLESDHLLAAIYKGISHSVFVVDVVAGDDFRYAGLNPRHEALTGIANHEIIGRRPSEVLPEEAAQQVLGRYRDCVQRKKTIAYEEWLPFQGKETCWETILHPQLDRGGQVKRIIGTSQEITERKKIETALQESETRFRTLIEAVPMSIMMLRNGKYTYGNPASARLLGFANTEEIIGIDAMETIDPDFRERVRQRIKCVDSGEMNPPMELKIRRPNGDSLWTISTSVPVHIGGEPATIIVGQDINDFKRIQEKLQDVTLQQLEAVKAAKVGLWDWCHDTDTVRYSAEWKRQIGYEDDEIANTLAEWKNRIHPEDLPATLGTIDDHIIQKKKNFQSEFRFRHRDGHYIWIEARGSILYNEDGTSQRMLGSHIDITHRKQMEARIQQAQKMESIGNLSGGIAHDFNNILFPIIAMAEMLLEDLPQDSLEYKNAREIYKAGNRGSELAKQILAFGRQSEEKFIPVGIQKILRDVLKLSRATIPSDIEIVQNIDIGCGMVLANPTQIHQIAMNLITNAYHAVEQNGGRISVELKEEKLAFHDPLRSKLKPGKYAKISVADTGCGMDPATVQKIFDPYFTTKEKGKGTGLGLAVVHGIVTAHHGEIRVASELGNGSRFEVFFPLMAEASKDEVSVTTLPLPTGTERILLVDDEEAILRVNCLSLERLGYQVTVRLNSREALEAFSANPDRFDLAITDMAMPGMAGDQLAKALLVIRPTLPIIICTGFSERIDQEKADAIGAKGFLMKPMVRADLARKVRQVLDQSTPD